MADYLRRRNVDAEEKLIELAKRSQGVTRQEALTAQLGISVSGVDALLKRLVSRGVIDWKNEERERLTGSLFGSSRGGGKVRSRSVRVYRYKQGSSKSESDAKQLNG